MKVGMGVYPPSHVEEILDARDRKAAGPKAAAKGLTLVSLDYETELKNQIHGENKDWSYTLNQEKILSEGNAWLTIHRCRAEDFDRLLVRVVHQAVQNGARTVFARDEETVGRIILGKPYGYYVFQADFENKGWAVTQK